MARLAGLEERPWSEWKNRPADTAPQLAAALAAFGVRPTTIRPLAGNPAKGYHRAAFEDAWTRYLPSAHPSL